MYACVNKTLDEIEYKTMKPRSHKYKKWGLVCNNTMSFDIETSNGFMKDGVIIPFDKTKIPQYWESYDKVGIMYIWQFAIEDNVFYGRTVDDLITFINELDEYCPYLKFVYVHNLGFEFNAVIRENFIIESLFARKERHPLTCTLQEYFIEFRCSYQLSGLSLDGCVREFKLSNKKLDTLDYLTLRTPKTKLSDNELQYCYNDVLIINEMISKYATEYKGIYNIPLTQTGEVRRDVRKIFAGDIQWLKLCKSLNSFDFEEYMEMCHLLTGGSTHANRLYVNRIINAIIKCFDFSSSYPWTMLHCKFPISKFITAEYDIKYDNPDKYTWIATIEFEDLECIKCNEYLSIHKALSKEKYLSDNGKLVKAKKCKYILTAVDMAIINECYTWENLTIINFKYAVVDYLPDKFRRYILELYNAKTTLKGVPEQADIYQKKKAKINACYGMMLTKIYNDVIKYSDGNWSCEKFNKFLFEQIKEENSKKALQNNFLAMQFGIYVTAWSRMAIYSIINPVDDLIHYHDTDSVYFSDDEVLQIIEEYNSKIPLIHKELAEQLNVDVSMFAPEDIKGIKHPIGIMDFDGEYIEGVYLGAKRYCLRKPNGELKQTVAGVRKGSVTALNDDLRNFNKSLIYDYDESQKLIMTYNERQQKGIVWNKGQYDEWVSYNEFSNNLMPTTYRMNITDDYLKLVEYYQNESEVI